MLKVKSIDFCGAVQAPIWRTCSGTMVVLDIQNCFLWMVSTFWTVRAHLVGSLALHREPFPCGNLKIWFSRQLWLFGSVLCDSRYHCLFYPALIFDERKQFCHVGMLIQPHINNSKPSKRRITCMPTSQSICCLHCAQWHPGVLHPKSWSSPPVSCGSVHIWEDWKTLFHSKTWFTGNFVTNKLETGNTLIVSKSDIWICTGKWLSMESQTAHQVGSDSSESRNHS